MNKRVNWIPAAVMLLTALCAVLCACGASPKSPGSIDSAGAGTVAKFSFALDPACGATVTSPHLNADGSPVAAPRLELVTSGSPERIVLDVRAAEPLSVIALAGELKYDDEALQAVRISYSPRISPPDAGLELHDFTNPGSLSFAAMPLPAGGALPSAEARRLDFVPGELLARVSFERLAHRERRNTHGALAQTRPGSALSLSSTAYKSPLIYYQHGNELGWDYINPGDYDQNGLVSPADLTQIGLNFNRTVLNPLDNSIDINSAVAVADGNGDGKVTVGDLSVIGQNLGGRVSGYALFRGSSGDLIPTDSAQPTPLAGGPDTGELLAQVTRGNALGDKASERLHFRISLPELQAGEALWLRPLDGDSQGAVSSHVYVPDPLSGVDDEIYNHDFSLSVLEDSYASGGNLERASLRLNSGADSTEAAVYFSGNLGIGGLLCALHYDPQRYSRSSSSQFLSRRTRGRLIVPSNQILSINSGQAGTADFLPQPDTADDPLDHASQDLTQLAYDPQAGLLSWDYRNNGDTNQDGYVGFDDFVPIGNFFGESVTGDWLAWIDANSNAIIDVNDLTRLGLHYGEHVEGYALYVGVGVLDPLATPLAEIPFSAASGDRLHERLHFEYPIELQENEYAWVVPFDGAAQGQYSNAAALPGSELWLEILAASAGDGTAANPYLLMADAQFPLKMYYLGSDDVSVDELSSYVCSDSQVIAFLGVDEAKLIVPSGYSGSFTLSGSFSGMPSNVVHVLVPGP